MVPRSMASALAAIDAGVVFATLLATQQAGTFLGLMSKNTMLIDHSGADIWVIPAGAQTLRISLLGYGTKLVTVETSALVCPCARSQIT